MKGELHTEVRLKERNAVSEVGGGDNFFRKYKNLSSFYETWFYLQIRFKIVLI